MRSMLKLSIQVNGDSLRQSVTLGMPCRLNGTIPVRFIRLRRNYKCACVWFTCSFFPNGGRHQPGCGKDITGICSHQRSYKYFCKSISKPLSGYQCNAKHCLRSITAVMGGEPGSFNQWVLRNTRKKIIEISLFHGFAWISLSEQRENTTSLWSWKTDDDDTHFLCLVIVDLNK